MFKRCIGVAVVLICLFLFGKFLITQFLFSEPTILQEAPSPNGKYIAYVYESNGGATTDWTYRLSILRDYEKLGKGVGNTYICDCEFTVEWKDDKTVHVNNYPMKDIFKQRERVRGIEVTYNFYE